MYMTKAHSSPGLSPPRRTWRPPKYQTKNTPALMNRLVIIQKTIQWRSALTLTSRRSVLRRSKRSPSRRSWAKALTTRMPRIDSFRCDDRRDHLAENRIQCSSMRRQISIDTIRIAGIGSSTHRVSSQLSWSRMPRIATTRSPLLTT